jgi:mannose-6-phosphate isomerase-like protein (cupin superfamily)
MPKKKGFICRDLADVESIEIICGKLCPLTTKDDFIGGNVSYLEANRPALKAHYHKETTEFYIIDSDSGVGTLELNKEKIDLYPDRVIMIKPGTTHRIIPDEGQVLEIWVVAIPAFRPEDEFVVE